MKSEIEIQVKIASLRTDMKVALLKGLTWSTTNTAEQIKALQWVLGGDEK